MSSTLQALRSTILAQTYPLPLAPDKVLYGFKKDISADLLPFVALSDFRSVKTYQTNGPAYRTSTLTIHVFARTLEEAERIGLGIDQAFDTVRVTPLAMSCLQNFYQVVNEEEYLYHVMMEYEITENIS